MTPRVVSSLLVLGAALLAAPASAANPTKEQCIAANDHAQEFRQAGKLSKARAQLLVCVAQSCPGPVREDCADRLKEVESATPSLIFEAKDIGGNDMSAVKVTVDGQPLASKLDGSPLQVDPGEHRFTFEDADGLTHTARTIVVREGDKGRHVQVVLGGAQTTPSDAGQPASTETPSDGSTQRTIGLVVGGAGLIGVVLGGVFGLVSKSTYNNALQNECANNPNTCTTQGAQDGQSAHSQATISTVGFIAGGVLLAGGAALYFTAPKAGSVAVAPTMGTTGGGLSVVGAW